MKYKIEITYNNGERHSVITTKDENLHKTITKLIANEKDQSIKITKIK